MTTSGSTDTINKGTTSYIYLKNQSIPHKTLCPTSHRSLLPLKLHDTHYHPHTWSYHRRTLINVRFEPFFLNQIQKTLPTARSTTYCFFKHKAFIWYKTHMTRLVRQTTLHLYTQKEVCKVSSFTHSQILLSPRFTWSSVYCLCTRCFAL